METTYSLDQEQINSALNAVFGSALICYGILILIVLVVIIVLLAKLSKSMTAASLNNARINQYLAAVPNDYSAKVASLYMNTKKELGIALVLTLFFGGMGAHKVYLGEKTAAILFFLFSFTLIPNIIALFNFVDMPKTISEYNLTVVQGLYQQFAPITKQ